MQPSRCPGLDEFDEMNSPVRSVWPLGTARAEPDRVTF
jgi:hypothetical protein